MWLSTPPFRRDTQYNGTSIAPLVEASNGTIGGGRVVRLEWVMDLEKKV
jgi:hypothetical protein